MKPIWQAPSAEVYGAVTFGEGTSVWPQAVIRAESHEVHIGDYTNVQDHCMVHIGLGPTHIGAYCSLTHHSTVHGATIGDNVLIGINATVMDDAVIGDNCIIAGHTIITEGTVIAPNSVVAGVPGKVVASRDNTVANKMNAIGYFENAKAYAAGQYRRWSDPDYIEQMNALRCELEAQQAT